MQVRQVLIGVASLALVLACLLIWAMRGDALVGSQRWAVPQGAVVPDDRSEDPQEPISDSPPSARPPRAAAGSTSDAQIERATRLLRERSGVISKSHFDQLLMLADAGDPRAARELHTYGQRCEDLFFIYGVDDDSHPGPDLASESTDPRVARVLLSEERRRLGVCRAIGPEAARNAYNRLLDAALRGDREAVLRLRYAPPRLQGDNRPYRMEDWRSAVVDTLHLLGDDPDALLALGDVYERGLVGRRDLVEAARYYRRALDASAPGTEVHERAGRHLSRLEESAGND